MYLSAEGIKEKAVELGADAVGIARVGQVKNKNKFLEWLARGYAGEMKYLSRNQEERFNPAELLPGAKSIVTIGVNYFPTDDDRAGMQGPYKIARYAWGEDYHRVIRRILKKLRSYIEEKTPGLNSRICVDTAPFTDVYWAQTAGLGWQGKNTALISGEFGTWLLLGSLITDVKIDKYDRPQADHCGTCTACIDSCPTGAIEKPYILNAVRCISYWTIESKAETFPDDIKNRLQGWIFGCDICLEVCPFNRFARPRKMPSFARSKRIAHLENGSVLKYSETEFENAFRLSPVSRPGFDGIRRNINQAQGTISKKKR